MHTVDLLEMAIHHAQELGFQVREDWLDGASGGACEIAGQWWIFLDLAQTPQERLDVMAECLDAFPCDGHVNLPPDLRALIQSRRAA